MQAGAALLAGAVGGMAVSLVLAIARTTGAHADWELMLGTIMAPGSGDAALTLGYVVHLALSGALGLLYAGAFYVTRTASAQVGMLFGLVHTWIVAMVGGLALLLLPSGAVAGISAHMSPVGATAFLLAQLTYGIVVGAVYGLLLERRRQTAEI